jgi:hypothetical protein
MQDKNKIIDIDYSLLISDYSLVAKCLIVIQERRVQFPLIAKENVVLYLA